MIEELIKRILDKLSGADFWIAAGFLVVGVVCWLLIGKTKKQEKRLLRQQIVSAIVLLILAAGFIWLNHRFFIRELIFSKNVTGILVMRMVGDDALNSLQGDLVAKLNAELQKEAPGQQIEVRARAETLEESEGLTAAHERARAIGQRLNAKLVIWGRKIGDKKFYPRITVMAAPKDWSAARERTHEEQSITELHLPEEVVDEPFYLIHFAAGYVYYGQNDYKEALRHFKAALVRKGATRDELADLQFFTAFCHSELAAGQKNMTADLREAIELYENAGKVYEARSNLDHWASVQNNLGSAYCNLPDGDRVANLQKAIAAYEAALRVHTEKDFPTDWAITQNNLGSAYCRLPTGDRAANLQKGITAYEAALRVITEKNFPYYWAGTQNNLGIAYRNLPTGDHAANLEKAIAAYQAALRVFTEKNFAYEWAMTQNNLGVVYKNMPGTDRSAYLQKAIAAYEAALRVYTEKDFPADWAMTQNNLGNTYRNLLTGDRDANFEKGIAAYQAALRVYTEKNFPVSWAIIHYNLGLLYAEIPGGNRTENLKNAKFCLEGALRVYTESSFPVDHRDTAMLLADVEDRLRDLAPK